MVNMADLGTVFRNKGKSFFHPEFMKEQSLILASLALVVSRIVVANVSAMQARGTADGPYRYRESIRTDMREVGGFTLGFLVLRAFQAGIRKGLRTGLNIKPPEDGGHHYNLFANLKKVWKNGEPPAAFERDYAKEVKVQFNQKGDYGKLGNWMMKHAPGVPKDAEKAASYFSKLYKRGPIILGSIPTVLLAGFMLERMTRDHSEAVVDAVSKSFGSGSKEPQATVNPNPVAPVGTFPAPAMGAPQFGTHRVSQPYPMRATAYSGMRI